MSVACGLALAGKPQAVKRVIEMKKRKSFLLRMDPALYEILDGWAQQELRSLNGQIEFLLKEAVAQRLKKVLRDDEATSDETKS